MSERNRHKSQAQWERADRALREATRQTVKQYRELGLPIAVERDGEVVWLDPSEIEVPAPAGPGGFVLEREIEAANPETAREWLCSNCPLLFSLLKGRLEVVVPDGLLAYLSPRRQVEALGLALDEIGTEYLLQAEQALRVVEQAAGRQELQKLSPRLASVGDEGQLIQLLCEVSVYAAVAAAAEVGSLTLEPRAGTGHCDFKARLAGHDLWGEVKRYSDTWVEKTLSERAPDRALSTAGRRLTPEATRPGRARAEILRSKLDPGESRRGVPDQFSAGEFNVLFLFEDAWTPLPHVRAALFGDRFYFRDPGEDRPDPDGLFARENWRVVSACCWMTAPRPAAATQGLWLNPQAARPLPAEVVEALATLS